MLTYISLLIYLIGILLIIKNKYINNINNKKIYLGWLLVGLSGWLLFMAKPPVAAFLAILTLAWAFLYGYIRTKGFFISILLSMTLTVITAYMIEGSLYNFYMRYKLSIYDGIILKSHDQFIYFGIVNFLKFLYKSLSNYKIILFITILFITGNLLSYCILTRHNQLLIAINIIVIVLLVVIRPIFGLYKFLDLYGGFLIIIIPIGSIISSINMININFSIEKYKFSIGWFILLISIAFSYGLGSNNGLIITLSYASFFLFLGLLIIISKLFANKKLLLYIFCLSMITQIILVNLLNETWSRPYRHSSPLWYNHFEIDIPKGGPKLLVSFDVSNFITRLYLLSDYSDFKNDTPVFDLTGSLPGVAYLLNGSTPGTPWLMSSYEGSEKYANMVIKNVPCSILQNSWLFYDNNNVFKNFKIDTLNNSGIDLKNYIVIGSIKSISIMSFKNIYFDLTFLKQTRLNASSNQFCLRARGAEK
jgi:hypothetical protein